MKNPSEISMHALDSVLHSCQLLQNVEWDPKSSWSYLLCCTAGHSPLQWLLRDLASAKFINAVFLWSSPHLPEERTVGLRLSDCSWHLNPILSHVHSMAVLSLSHEDWTLEVCSTVFSTLLKYRSKAQGASENPKTYFFPFFRQKDKRSSEYS